MLNGSYLYSRKLPQFLNGLFDECSTTMRIGGAGGGGVQVTPSGLDLVRRYCSTNSAAVRVIAARILSR